MDATKGIHPGFTGNVQGTVSQSWLSWKAGIIVCSWPSKKFTGEGKEESLQNVLVVKRFPFWSLDKGIKYPTRQQHFLPFTGSQHISIIWPLPNYILSARSYTRAAEKEPCRRDAVLPCCCLFSGSPLPHISPALELEKCYWCQDWAAPHPRLQLWVLPAGTPFYWAALLWTSAHIWRSYWISFLAIFFFLWSTTYLQRILCLGKDVYLL